MTCQVSLVVTSSIKATPGTHLRRGGDDQTMIDRTEHAPHQTTATGRMCVSCDEEAPIGEA